MTSHCSRGLLGVALMLLIGRHRSPLQKCLFRFFVFFNQVVFLLVSCKCSFLCILDTSSLSHIWLANFLSIVWVLFSLCWQCPLIKVLCWWIYQFSFVACAFGVISKKPLPNPRSRRFILTFLLRMLALMFTVLIHFELILIFMYVCKGAQFHSFACGYPFFSSSICWKDYSFLICIILIACEKSIDPKYVGLFLYT